MKKRIVESDRSDPLAHRDLGAIYADSGSIEAAILELRTAMVFDPEDAETYTQIARLYQSIGKKEEAKAELNRAKQLPSRRLPSLQEMLVSIESPAP